MDLIEHVLLVSEYLEGTGKQVPGRSLGWLLVLGTQIVILLLWWCCCCCCVFPIVVLLLLLLSIHVSSFIRVKEQVVPIVIARGSSFS